MLNAVLSVSKHICGRSNRTYHKLQAILCLFKKIIFLSEQLCYCNLFRLELYFNRFIYISTTYIFSYMEVFESYCILRNGTKFSISENRMITTEILILSLPLHIKNSDSHKYLIILLA